MLFLKFLILLVIFFSSLVAKPIVTENYKYYDIYPTNIHKLEIDMDKASPLKVLGSVRHGTVGWKIKYYYKRERKKGICSITKVKTKVDITYFVPKIAPNCTSPEGTRIAFQRYYAILKEYLKKYSDNGVAAANEIEEKLLKVKPIKNDCELIRTNAKKVASNIIKKYKKKDKDYEINTYEGFLDSVRIEKLL